MNWQKLKWKLIHFKRRFLPVDVSDTLRGRVTYVEDGEASLSLETVPKSPDQKPEKFYGHTQEYKLKKQGIEEGDRFWVRVRTLPKD